MLVVPGCAVVVIPGAVAPLGPQKEPPPCGGQGGGVGTNLGRLRGFPYADRTHYHRIGPVTAHRGPYRKTARTSGNSEPPITTLDSQNPRWQFPFNVLLWDVDRRIRTGRPLV